MKNFNVHSYDTMNLIEKRLAILVGAKFIDRTKISEAIEEMNKLRKGLTIKAKGYNGVKEIRKWRDNRCKY